MSSAKVAAPDLKTRPVSDNFFPKGNIIMGRACSTNGGVEECIEEIGGKARRKETAGKTKT
jgi:hypothetical protein